jgi:hypothetical protein
VSFHPLAQRSALRRDVRSAIQIVCMSSRKNAVENKGGGGQREIETTAPSVAKPRFGPDGAWLLQYTHTTPPEFFPILDLSPKPLEGH